MTTYRGVKMIGSFVVFSCLVAASRAQALLPPNPSTCPPNEVLEGCANALCVHQECVQRGKPIGCPSVASCEAACVCAYGYLRNYNGTCVPDEQCEPQPCPNQYELYTKSKDPCARETCASLAPDYKCSAVSASAAPGCACAHELYVRRDAGAPCDTYVCDCPEMAASPQCSASIFEN